MSVFSKAIATRSGAALIALAFIAMAAWQIRPRGALAETQPAATIAAPNPVDDFKKQSTDVQKSLQSVLQKIDQSAKEIETLSKPETAHAQIEDLQHVIADALGTVADNGPVATLGAKALKFATDKQKQFETDTEFAPEDRAMLLRQWRTIREETERATADLAKARDEFAQLLRTVQTRGDFIAELQAINNAQRMLEVVRQLAGEIRNTSDAMKAYVRNIVPPGS
jgi:hypothetical protein